MSTAPYAPWVLTGESITTLVWAPSARAALPAGLARLPGPILIVAVRYTASPVGPYLELAIGEPARLGSRPGFCITTMVVDSSESRVGGRLNWGYPKELGRLLWHGDGPERELRWVERGIRVHAHASGPPWPVLVPVRSLQRRADGPVVVPGRLRGRARFSRVEISTPADDPLAGLSGRHVGVCVAGMRFVVKPARHPAGWASTLRAPLRAPEPAMFVPLPHRAAPRSNIQEPALFSLLPGD